MCVSARVCVYMQDGDVFQRQTESSSNFKYPTFLLHLCNSGFGDVQKAGRISDLLLGVGVSCS